VAAAAAAGTSPRRRSPARRASMGGRVSWGRAGCW
jgi:hypothetical protein